MHSPPNIYLEFLIRIEGIQLVLANIFLLTLQPQFIEVCRHNLFDGQCLSFEKTIPVYPHIAQQH